MNYRSKTPVSENATAILNAAKMLNKLTSNAALNNASQRLSATDKEVADLMHQIEVANASAVDGYKLFASLQNVLVKRRMIKNEINMIKSIRDTFTHSVVRLENMSQKAYFPSSVK